MDSERPVENFVSEQNGAYFADFYRERNLSGGHVILLNPAGTPEYQADLKQAGTALAEWPGHFQIGGGVTDQNAAALMEAGASHVIVTSFVFRDGTLSYINLKKLIRAVGREHLVLDLSCRKKDGEYRIVTDRWQIFTEMEVTPSIIAELGAECDEILVHYVDSEGTMKGIEEELVTILAEGAKRSAGQNGRQLPITYAGGIHSLSDIERIGRLGEGTVDFTVGSALQLFGGSLDMDEIVRTAAAFGGRLE